jgi:hypothetical protein
VNSQIVSDDVMFFIYQCGNRLRSVGMENTLYSAVFDVSNRVNNILQVENGENL